MPRKSEPKLRNKVRELRTTRSGLTQQALADEVGVTRQTIVAMESSAYTPSLPLAIRIARVFGLAVEEVFTLDE
ncbi:helix-turn-helix transcriptional regulator [Novipirellula sp. SH528]|uniref:helix-turn-helix transcriptional regulator n=1 Tax=Novipirellula sp. SH528 TaxID=3454466 RepID=UPI003F9F7326